MSKSLRRPQRLFSLAMWVLSLLFAAMLVGLGGLVIADLPNVETRITVEQFVDRGAVSGIDRRLAALEPEIRAATANTETVRGAYRAARADYDAARESLQAWLAARSVTEENTQNPEVLTRTRAVEALRLEERAALSRLEAAQARRTELSRERGDLRRERQSLYIAAQPQVEAARRARDLKVFLYRLALTLPLLVVAGYFVARKRDSAYWPLYRGFVLFALFAFFVELVPYLPSYGGYIRYIVGVALVVVAGHYLIRTMRAYLERKQAEEARSEDERRRSIGYETALKKIGAATCPGCDRAIEKREGAITEFCVHCGIRLQRECGACGTRNISFHRYCLSCGTPMDRDGPRMPEVEPEAPSGEAGSEGGGEVGGGEPQPA